ncbi:hypothetical protein T11_8352 [Trichinella zimbabwensis]|uniref:Uncharacterized protein n=1 Tax=Trichinella zimbabwensis TaxID=268475 RepID=A0A0V1I548_9BILA|nr:hypothetical protein T11_8352 [Trichinella zimbabwensis]
MAGFIHPFFEDSNSLFRKTVRTRVIWRCSDVNNTIATAKLFKLVKDELRSVVRYNVSGKTETCEQATTTFDNGVRCRASQRGNVEPFRMDVDNDQPFRAFEGPSLVNM